MTRTSGKLGRHPAKRLALRYLHQYSTTPVPAPIYPIDVTGNIADGDWGMLGNDRVGDCAFAGQTHYEMATAAAGHAKPGVQLTAEQEIAAYFAYTDMQDIGANLADALLYWYRAGKILAFAPVDHTNPAACDWAMSAFHGLYTGVNLTGADEQRFGNKQIWTVSGGESPDPQLGHCIVKVKADASTDTFVTWGTVQQADKGWTAACVEEAWVIITTEDLRATDIDLAALRADIDALGGLPRTVVIPPAIQAGVFGFVKRKVRAAVDFVKRLVLELMLKLP